MVKLTCTQTPLKVHMYEDEPNWPPDQNCFEYRFASLNAMAHLLNEEGSEQLSPMKLSMTPNKLNHILMPRVDETSPSPSSASTSKALPKSYIDSGRGGACIKDTTPFSSATGCNSSSQVHVASTSSYKANVCHVKANPVLCQAGNLIGVGTGDVSRPSQCVTPESCAIASPATPSPSPHRTPSKRCASDAFHGFATPNKRLCRARGFTPKKVCVTMALLLSSHEVAAGSVPFYPRSLH